MIRYLLIESGRMYGAIILVTKKKMTAMLWLFSLSFISRKLIAGIDECWGMIFSCRGLSEYSLLSMNMISYQNQIIFYHISHGLFDLCLFNENQTPYGLWTKFVLSSQYLYINNILNKENNETSQLTKTYGELWMHTEWIQEAFRMWTICACF